MKMYQGTAGAVLAALQAFDLKAERRNRYRSNSPLRPGSNSHGFTLTVRDDEHGAFYDHVTQEYGSLYQLAERLGIERPRNDPAGGEKPSKRMYRDLAEYAEAHYAPLKAFEAADWKMIRNRGRPALAFTTPTGTRYRYLDDQQPPYRSPSGYERCWYRLPEAITLAGDGPIVLCNGEASTVVAQYHRVPATCVTGGEKASLPDHLVAALRDQWSGAVLIAFDADQTGRTNGPHLAAQLAAAGIDARAVDMMPGVHDGFDLADWCGLHQEASYTTLTQLSMRSPETDERESASAESRPRFIIRSEAWLDTIPPPRWLLEGELLAGAFNLVYGASGSGKTFVALDRALRVAAAGHRALYIATEDLPGVRQRVRAWRQHYSEHSGRLDILEMPEGIDLAAPSQIDALLEVLSGQAYTLITIDTLREAHTGDENSSTDMARVNRAIQRIIRTTGAAVEVLHHSGVNDGRERGSTALSANCDLKWKVSNDDGVIELSCEKFRHGAELETRYFALSAVGDSAVTVPTVSRRLVTERLDKTEREILEFLALEVFEEIGAKQAQIRASIGAHERQIYRKLSNLKRRGYISQGSKGEPYRLTPAGRAAIGSDDQIATDTTDTAVQSPTDTTDTQLTSPAVSPLTLTDTDTPFWVSVSVRAVRSDADQGSGESMALPEFSDQPDDAPESEQAWQTGTRFASIHALHLERDALVEEYRQLTGLSPRDAVHIEDLPAFRETVKQLRHSTQHSPA